MQKIYFGFIIFMVVTGCSRYSVISETVRCDDMVEHVSIIPQRSQQNTEGENIHIFEGLKPLDEHRLVLRISVSQLQEAGIEITDLNGKEFIFIEKKGEHVTPARIVAGEKEIFPSTLWARIWVNENLEWYFKKLGVPTIFEVEGIYWVNMKICQDNNWHCTVFEGTEIKEIDGVEFVSYPTEQYPILITNP